MQEAITVSTYNIRYAIRMQSAVAVRITNMRFVKILSRSSFAPHTLPCHTRESRCKLLEGSFGASQRWYYSLSVCLSGIITRAADWANHANAHCTIIFRTWSWYMSIRNIWPFFFAEWVSHELFDECIVYIFAGGTFKELYISILYVVEKAFLYIFWVICSTAKICP